MRGATKFIVGTACLFFCLEVGHAQDKAAHPGDGAMCITPAAWYAMLDDAPRAVGARDLLPQMAERDVVLLGERHGDVSHHQWQLQTLAALHLLRPDMVIGFESFPRRVQAVLDRWVAGELTVKEFLDQTDWSKVWSFPPELYLPLFHFARVNRIPMVALNVDRTLTEAVRKNGWDAVPAERKEGVSRPAPASEAYRELLYKAFIQHSRNSKDKAAPAGRNDDAFRYFVEAQLTWERAMAQALASRVAENDSKRPLVVGIMGRGHIRGGHGVPRQLRDLGVRDIGTLLPVNAKRDCGEVERGMADAIFALPELPKEESPVKRLRQ